MSHALRVGVADQIGYFRAYNTDGSAKTDLTSSTTGLGLSVFRVGAAAVSISSLSAKAADNTAHADGAIRAVSGNLYTVDLPDAACADQVPSISVKGSYTGGVIEGPEHPLIGYNPATVAVGANTTTPPTVGAIADQVWDEARSGHVTAGTFGEKVNAELDSTTSTKIDNILEDTGVTLPTQIAGISSGGGDATLAKQEEILTALDELSAIQLAAVEVDAGTITGFPETLTIGDSYSVDTGQIRVNILDTVTEDPVDRLGSLLFSDADVSFTAFRPNDSARIVGTCEYIREPSSGTLTASYVLITLLTSETSKGKAEYTYEGRLKFVWQGPSSSDETDEEQKTYKTTPFKFIANP